MNWITRTSFSFNRWVFVPYREILPKGGIEMPSFKVAHLREQGIDLIVVPVDSTFGSQTTDAQNETINLMQAAAESAGLAGRVVPVWRVGGGMAFVAPPNWHAYFRQMTYDDVLLNINREIYW